SIRRHLRRQIKTQIPCFPSRGQREKGDLFSKESVTEVVAAEVERQIGIQGKMFGQGPVDIDLESGRVPDPERATWSDHRAHYRGKTIVEGGHGLDIVEFFIYFLVRNDRFGIAGKPAFRPILELIEPKIQQRDADLPVIVEIGIRFPENIHILRLDQVFDPDVDRSPSAALLEEILEVFPRSVVIFPRIVIGGITILDISFREGIDQLRVDISAAQTSTRELQITPRNAPRRFQRHPPIQPAPIVIYQRLAVRGEQFQPAAAHRFTLVDRGCVIDAEELIEVPDRIVVVERRGAGSPVAFQIGAKGNGLFVTQRQTDVQQVKVVIVSAITPLVTAGKVIIETVLMRQIGKIRDIDRVGGIFQLHREKRHIPGIRRVEYRGRVIRYAQGSRKRRSLYGLI